MHGTLSRGEFPRLIFRLGRGAATGELRITDHQRSHSLWLRRGYLVATRMGEAAFRLGEVLRDAGALAPRDLAAAVADGRVHGRDLVRRGLITEAALDEALRRQATMRLERLSLSAGARYELDAAGEPPAQLRTGRPLALTSWARRHLEARVDAVKARQLQQELAGARLALRKDLVPDDADLDDTDRRILSALAAPRRLDELERSAHAPRFRLLAFLHFLAAVGALEPLGVAAPRPTPEVPLDAWAAEPPSSRDEARRILGVTPRADESEVRRAYRRLARTWHPDMHPAAHGPARQALEARFAQLTDAYRALVSG